MFTNEQILRESNAPAQNPSSSKLTERSVSVYSDMGDIVHEGDIITLTGELNGFDPGKVTLQWQYDDGFYWNDVPGADKLTHAFVATPETINYSWRLSVAVNDEA